MTNEFWEECADWLNSSATQAVTSTVYTVPAEKTALLTEMHLTTDAAPGSPLKVTALASGAVLWTGLVSHLYPTVWRNNHRQIALAAGQLVQVKIEQTAAIQTLHYRICLVEQSGKTVNNWCFLPADAE
jgi:hypothetical protein